MKKKSKRTLTPKLRFPEFRDMPGWEEKQLGSQGDFLSSLTGKSAKDFDTGTASFIPYMNVFTNTFIDPSYLRSVDVSSGESQNAVSKGDIFFTVSSETPEEAGMSSVLLYDIDNCFLNSFCALFRFNSNRSPNSIFLGYLLRSTSVRKYLAQAAQGATRYNISKGTFRDLPLSLPPTNAEQQKIADCLSSLDGLIAAEGRKLTALKAHKRGLMQQLFPQPGQTKPRLRFPEFRNKGEWRIDSLGKVFDTSSGGTPDRSKEEYWNGSIPWITTSLVNFNVITEADESISDAGLRNSSAKVFPKKTVLVAMYGQGKTRGQVAMLGRPAATNQACAAILPRKGMDSRFVFQNLGSRYRELRSLSNSGGQKNLSQGLIQGLQFSYPNNIDEQRAIADCLTSLDDYISAQLSKLDALKTHKRGLMQQLFPAAEVS